jgi:hypothetical protein
MAAFIQRTEGVFVSHHYVAKLWRATGLKPHRPGTFKVSKDPAFAEKVADIGLTPESVSAARHSEKVRTSVTRDRNPPSVGYTVRSA